MALEASGTKIIPAEKGPARSTSGDWKQPDTHPLTNDKSGGQGAVENVGKNAGKLGKKGGQAKIW